MCEGAKVMMRTTRHTRVEQLPVLPSLHHSIQSFQMAMPGSSLIVRQHGAALARCLPSSSLSCITARKAPTSVGRRRRHIHSTASAHIPSPVNEAYPGHVPINGFQRSLLAVGSAITSLLDPHRHDMVATLGETTSDRQLPKLREALLSQSGEEGLQILRDRPRLSSETIDLEAMRALPEGSFGRAYIDWLEACKVTPDTREPVSMINDYSLITRLSLRDINEVASFPMAFRGPSLPGPLHRRS